MNNEAFWNILWKMAEKVSSNTIHSNVIMLISFLLSIVTTLSFFGYDVVYRMEQYGLITVLGCFLLFFFFYLLVGWVCWRFYEEYRKKRQQRISLSKRRQSIIDSFHRLTPWQQDFLRRAIRENKQQYSDYEIGPVHCIWIDEIKGLIYRRFITQRPGGIYIINDEYFDVLRSYFPPVQNQEDS